VKRIARLAAAITVAATAVVVAIPHARPSAIAQRVRAVAERAPTASERAPASTGEPGHFSKRRFEYRGVTYQYQVFLPHDYDIDRSWPVVVALHGSGEKGSDGVTQITTGVGPVLREQAATFPAVVIFPQVPREGQSIRHAPSIAKLIDVVVHEVHGDTSRVYLTGLSFGGVMAYVIARLRPEMFAAVVPVSAPLVIQDGDRSTRLSPADAHAEEARVLRHTPVWIFQGERDPNVPAAPTRELVSALKAAGLDVRYTEYADQPHEIWDRAYREPELWKWMFAQHR
jgi:predicted peptidase